MSALAFSRVFCISLTFLSCSALRALTDAEFVMSSEVSTTATFGAVSDIAQLFTEYPAVKAKTATAAI